MSMGWLNHGSNAMSYHPFSMIHGRMDSHCTMSFLLNRMVILSCMIHLQTSGVSWRIIVPKKTLPESFFLSTTFFIGVAALRWLGRAMTFCSPVLPARGVLQKSLSTLALNQISFVECPASCFARRAEARRVRSMPRVLQCVHRSAAESLDGFRPALP